ncbi:MAG: DUF1592 domain-containing protein [Alphaproteobacteria bacterium]|nr:DUF1592 domain-containing protein [Alphaproteobacteria bacterium]
MMVARTVICGLAAILLAACEPAETETSGAPAGMRRLTEEQYRNAIADIFGADIEVAGRFDPIVRPAHGLLAAGTSEISVSPAGFEQAYTMANSIAGQVLDAGHRDAFLTCTPADATKPDDVCARTFFASVGRLLFRRPLTDEELMSRVAAARRATEISGNFIQGVTLGLGSLLASPSFLFDVDETEPDPDRAGQRRLTAYAKASRLSFFLWNTTPDAELLDAAASSAIHSAKELARQVDRLMAAPRLEGAVRTFFADMLGLEAITNLVKDATLYPAFVRAVKADMPEQTLRTIVHHLLTKNGDYRDLFTTRETFITRALGLIYQVPVPQQTGWMPYTFSDDSGRAGLLTLMNFLAANSHDGRTSPTLRGKALREMLLCQAVPIPPGDVDFKLVQDTNNPNFKTTRDRLTAHRTAATCAGCHKITDPIGLGLEVFDTVGVARTAENGAMIDTSGDLDGVPFATPSELGRAVRDNPATASCLVHRIYEYAIRWPIADGERDWIKSLEQDFGKDGYRLKALMRRIAVSKAFYRIAPAPGNGA